MPKPALVRDIMTREVVTLFEEDNLLGVEEGMRHFRFRHLPVVDDGKLVGLITHRDLLRVAASIAEPGGEQKTHNIQERLFARDVMSRDLVSVREDTPIADAGLLMWNNKLGCLPVLSDDGRLLGIVTEADFVKLALRLLELAP
ncbi:MAG: CBS domain-containing protein [Polyangiaceae bacterium]|jgi:CBS domain-containing protein|nr:CBS domain-containing protein [Polyangiaceae bacterium]